MVSDVPVDVRANEAAELVPRVCRARLPGRLVLLDRARMGHDLVDRPVPAAANERTFYMGAMWLPGLVGDVVAVYGLEPDQLPVIDPAVDLPTGGPGIEQQMAAGRVGAEEPVGEAVARGQLAENA